MRPARHGTGDWVSARLTHLRTLGLTKFPVGGGVHLPDAVPLRQMAR